MTDCHGPFPFEAHSRWEACEKCGGSLKNPIPVPELSEILPELGLIVMEMEASMMHWSEETSEDLRAATEKVRRWMESRGIHLEAQHGTDIDQVPIFTSGAESGYQP